MRPRPRPALLVLAAVLAGLVHAPTCRAQTAAAAGDPAPPAARLVPHTSLLTTSDAWFGAGAAAAVALAGTMDRSAWQQVSAPDRPGLRRFADDVSPLGHPVVLAPAMLLGYASGRLLARPELSRASVRVALSVGAAGVATEALKLAVGRMRPTVAPGDPEDFRPFHGDASFPSGHTTLAFAAARALDRETDSRWVPLIAYPLAATVAWARVEEDEHWVSDVVAGAAVGWWTANKAEDFLRQRGADARTDGAHVGVLFSSTRRATRLGVKLRF